MKSERPVGCVGGTHRKTFICSWQVSACWGTGWGVALSGHQLGSLGDAGHQLSSLSPGKVALGESTGAFRETGPYACGCRRHNA